jgi:hypothetical protein
LLATVLLVGVGERINRPYPVLVNLIGEAVARSGLTLTVPFACYLLASAIGASGVLAVLAAALFLGRSGDDETGVADRLSGGAFWDTMELLVTTRTLAVGIPAACRPLQRLALGPPARDHPVGQVQVGPAGRGCVGSAAPSGEGHRGEPVGRTVMVLTSTPAGWVIAQTIVLASWSADSMARSGSSPPASKKLVSTAPGLIRVTPTPSPVTMRPVFSASPVTAHFVAP